MRLALVAIGLVTVVGCKQASQATLKDDTTNQGGNAADLKMCTEQVAAPAGPAPAPSSPSTSGSAPTFIPPALELTDGGDFIPTTSDGGDVPSDMPIGPAPGPNVASNPSSSPSASPSNSPAPAPAQANPRSGRMDKQLAPSFFEDMVACNTAVPALPDQDGKINNDGDCEYPGKGGQPFFSCHYHLGIEFAGKNNLKRDEYGEIHCIFPNGPRGITVFGGHFTCKRKDGQAKFDDAGGHGVKNATCSKNVIAQVAAQYTACSQKSCCDDGTLTGAKRVKTPGTKGNPDEVSNLYHTAGLTKAEQGLEVRPDFRLCSQPIELDCDELAVWGGHKANAPKFGASGKFWYPQVTAAGKKVYEDAKREHPAEGHHP